MPSASATNKPRVLIAMHYLELGGAETSLIGLLQEWDYSKADIDLFLYSHRGELMKHIPPHVNLLPQKRAYSVIESPIKEAITKGCLGVAFGRWRAKREVSKTRKWDSHSELLGRYITPFLPSIGKGTYDLAISFLTPHHPVLHRCKARCKICWIHTDYTNMNLDAEAEQAVWGEYDNIVSISPSVTEGFCKKMPALRDKIIEIENIIPENLVRSQAKEYIPSEFSHDNFNMLSVGRYTYAKNFDNVPDIMRRLIEITRRKDLHWYLLGYGGDEPIIRKRIIEAGVEANVHLLGKRDNPYPYIAECDLYLQPSRFEGKSIAVREAQMLGRPVIITSFVTAHSQLRNGEDGLIVPSDNAGCAQGIADAITSPGILNSISSMASSRNYSGREGIDKLLSLINPT